MRFTVSREALLRPLQIVSGAVEKRQALPILANILVKVEKQGLILTGTDLEVELQARAQTVDSENGETTLPARKLFDICRALPDGASIDVRIEEEKAVVRSGRSRFTLATLSASEFPGTESSPGSMKFEIPERDLKYLLEQTQFCMANQDVRYYLNGLLLELENTTIRAVGTDGHRLAVCEIPADLVVGDKKQAIIPRKGVTELGRLLEDGDGKCSLELGANQVRIGVRDIIFTSKLIDGRFPDYERVIPVGTDKRVTAERGELRQALSRASILSNEKYRGIRLVIGDNLLRALVHNPEQEEAEEELEVQTEGGQIEIGFNVAYLLDALAAVKEEQVEVLLSDPNASCLVKGVGNDSARYVVMPMRL